MPELTDLRMRRVSGCDRGKSRDTQQRKETQINYCKCTTLPANMCRHGLIFSYLFQKINK